MSKYSNSSKENFLKSIPTESLDNSNCNITDRCKFNFSFLDTSQEAGQDFKDWSKD